MSKTNGVDSYINALKNKKPTKKEIRKRIEELWKEIEPEGRNITLWTWEGGMKLFDKMIEEEYDIEKNRR